MMRHAITTLVLVTWLIGCGARQISDGDSEGEDLAGSTPEWSPCALKGDVESCDELCAAHDMTCIENGCAAQIDYCDPEPCELATQALAGNDEALCADPSSVAEFVATTCDAPIHWLFSTALRCCCADQD